MSEDRVKIENQKNQYTGNQTGQRGRSRVRTITVTSIGQPSPPDGGWGYAVILGVTIGFMMLGGFHRSSPLIYQQLYERFSKSATETAWVFSISGICRFMISPLASICCNRFGVRASVIFGTLLASGGAIASAWPPSLWYMYITYGIMLGLGNGFTVTSCFIIVGQYFDKKRGMANALATMGGGIGGMLISPLVTVMFDHYGYSGTMLLLGGILLHALISAALFRPLTLSKTDMQEMEEIKKEMQAGETKENGIMLTVPETRERSHSALETTEPLAFGSNLSIAMEDDEEGDFNVKEINNLSQDESVKIKKKKGFCAKYFNPELIKEKKFLSFSLMMMCVFVCFSCMTTFMAALAKEKGITTTQFAIILMAAAATDLVGRFSSGFIFDLKIVIHRRMLLFSLLGLTFSTLMAMLPFAYNFETFIVIITFRALFGSAFHAHHNTILNDMVGKKRLASAIGLSRAVMGLGYVMGPTIGGALRDWSGEYRYTYFFGGTSSGVGILLLMILNYKHIIYGSKSLK